MVSVPNVDEDPRIEDLLSRWRELQSSGSNPLPSALTDDPDLLVALTRAIAAIEAAEEGLGLGLAAVAVVRGVPNRFEVFGKPLEGGMGEVYRARDLELQGRVVAYKVMKARGEPTSADVRQFYREARITDRVRQPGVVPIYAQLRDDSGRPAYAMEWLEGETIGEVREGLQHCGSEHGVEVLRRFLEACRIVGVAHGKGVVHGDLNSKNLMLIEERRATRVVDWGSAVEVGTKDESRPSHAVAPDYRDPALGPGDPPTFLSDIYALGINLRKLTRSFETNRVIILEGRKQSSALRGLRAIAEKAAANRPDDRYPNVEALASDLERFLASQRVQADHGEPLGERAWRWASRHRAAVTAVVVVTMLSAVATALVSYFVQEASHARRVALNSQFVEITAVCQMLEKEDLPSAQDDLDQRRIVQEVVKEKDRDTAHLAQSLESLEKSFAAKNEVRARGARERQKEIEKRLDAGFHILQLLIEEYPKHEAAYRLILANGYINLSELKIGRLAKGEALAATVSSVLMGKPRPSIDGTTIASALTLSDKALSLLPPAQPGMAADDAVRKTLQDAFHVKIVGHLCLNQYTEALRYLEQYLGVSSEPVSPVGELHPTLLKAAETEQQRLPWSRPPAVDHAKAVAMAEFLASQREVSDAAVYNAACACSLASTDQTALPHEKEKWAAQAVGYLRRIADKGYFHGFRLYPPPITDTIKELQTDHDLDPLRSRPDFKALIEKAVAK